MISPWVLSFVAILCFSTVSFCVSRIYKEAIKQTTLDTPTALSVSYERESRSHYMLFLVMVTFFMFVSGVVLTLGAVWRFTH